MNSELIHIARAAKLILTLCHCGPIHMQRDRSIFRLLQRYLYNEVLKNDLINEKGKRHISTSDLHPLIGYDLDPNHSLSKYFDVFYTINMQDYTKIVIDISSFIPAEQTLSPPNATHCSIITVTAALDFHNYSAWIQSAQSSLFPLNCDPVNSFSLTMKIPPSNDLPVIILMAIAFSNTTDFQAVKIIHIKNAL